MDVPATGALLSGGARCAVSGIPTALLIAGCFKTDHRQKNCILGPWNTTEK
jgi:hypothetical protein